MAGELRGVAEAEGVERQILVDHSLAMLLPKALPGTRLLVRIVALQPAVREAYRIEIAGSQEAERSKDALMRERVPQVGDSGRGYCRRQFDLGLSKQERARRYVIIALAGPNVEMRMFGDSSACKGDFRARARTDSEAESSRR
jgi:hypothetical protein